MSPARNSGGSSSGRGRSGGGRSSSSSSSGRGAPGGKGRTGGSGRPGSSGAGAGGGRSGPPPTRMRPGASRPRPIPSGRRGQVRRSPGGGGGGSSSAGRGLGGDQVEGRQAVRELLTAGTRRIREVWIVADAEPSEILDDIRELADGDRVQVREVGRGKFAAQARCEAPQGVLALAAPLDEADLDELAAGTGPARRRTRATTAPFLVALDGVTDPGNLGAVLRSAECAGATGIVLPRHRAVHVTPAATKAAAGAIEHLPIALVGGLPAALARLRDAGVLVVGLDVSADRPLYDLSPADGPVCLVLGAEGRGLSRLVRERCDEVLSIPLQGRLASLNVASAATLACYEVARQRRGPRGR